MGKNIDNLLRNHNIESTDNWTAKAIADNNAVYTASQQSSEPTETYEYYTDGSIKKRTVSENGVVTVYNYAENGKLTDKSVTETITQ